jgi:hypothetical protein
MADLGYRRVAERHRPAIRLDLISAAGDANIEPLESILKRHP